MKPLVSALLIGALVPGPTPPPGPPLPGPPPIMEPAGPSMPSATLTGPATIPPLATLSEPPGSRRPAPSRTTAAASPAAPEPISQSPVAVSRKSDGSRPWIVLGVVLALAGSVGWFTLRRRRHG